MLVVSLAKAAPASDAYKPVQWTEFVRVDGQSEPVPVQWLQDPEARFAYSLKLPDAVPKLVPFDFRTAYWRGWIPGKPNLALQYFNHLCSTEAGEWILKKANHVEGLYFARPQDAPTTDVMKDPYGPEMPWIQRYFMNSGGSLLDEGRRFMEPPHASYHFIEEPRRATKWQAYIEAPYVRLHGYTRGFFVKSGQVVEAWNDLTPMQVLGIPASTARYGYTWRGLKRDRDRELGIAGGEAIIYDLQTNEILAVRRQFLINRRHGDRIFWENAASCPQPKYVFAEFRQFALDVLDPIAPSNLRHD